MFRNRKKIEGKYIIIIVVILIILSLALYVKTLKEDRKLNMVESLIKDSVIFVEKIILTPFNYVGNLIDDFSELRNVQEENDKLKTSIERVDAIETENIELRREIEALKKELSIDYVLTDYDYLNATVISRNIGYWYNTLTIDKGTNNGISEGMVVVNSTGLIGKIIKTTTFTAEIRLITTSDTNNKISVSISNGNGKINGLINRYDYENNLLEVEGISNTEEVKVGDYVYTSGLGGVFPSGILIGTVESITTDEYDLAKIINVKPSTDFNDINYVAILKRKDSE